MIESHIYNILSRESYLALSDLSRIAAVDGELAHSLVSQLTEDMIQIISSLGDISFSMHPLNRTKIKLTIKRYFIFI